MALILIFRSEWSFVEINGGYGSAGFFFNESGLQYAADKGFSGWLGKRFPPFSFVARQLRCFSKKVRLIEPGSM